MATVKNASELKSKGEQVRSRFRMQSTGLLIGLLALVLSGCGTFGGGAKSRPVLIGGPVIGTSETPVATAAEPLASALPAETRGEAVDVAVPRAADLVTGPANPAFIPVALEPAPPGEGSYLLA